MNDRLYRSREDRLIGGVCAGIADRLDLDPSLVRIGWALLTIFTGGAFLVVYIVMLVVVPEEPLGGMPPMAPPPEPGAVPGWQAPGAVPGWQAPDAGQAGWQTPYDTSAGAAAEGAGAGEAAAAAAGAGEPTTGEPSATGWQAPPGAASYAAGAAPAWTPPDQAYAARRAARAERSRRREGTIGLVFGLLLILLGVWFLFRQYLPDIDLESFWPIAIIALGALLLLRAFRFDRSGDGS